MPNAVEPWNQCTPSGNRLTKKALTMRWIKTTIQHGCRCSVSFHVSEWSKWTQDIPTTASLLNALTGKQFFRYSHEGRTILLKPPTA